jgi:hypothetical protein
MRSATGMVDPMGVRQYAAGERNSLWFLENRAH